MVESKELIQIKNIDNVLDPIRVSCCVNSVPSILT